MDSSENVLQKMCRACMCENQYFLSIYDKTEGRLTICEMFAKTLPQFTIHSNDELPKNICVECMNTLLIVYKFQQMCITSTTCMRSLLVSNSNITDQQEEANHAIEASKLEGYSLVTQNPLKTLCYLKVEMNDDEAQRNYIMSKPSDDYHNKDDRILDTSENLKHNQPLTKEFQNYIKLEAYDNHLTTETCPSDDSELQVNSNLDVSKPNQQPPVTSNNNETGIHEIEKPNSKPRRNNNFRCLHCDAAFNSNYKLKYHARVHLETRPFVCEICKYRFRKNRTLAIHRHTHETSPSEGFKCPECPRRFKKQLSMSLHVRSHDLKNFVVCEHCDKEFPSKTSRLAHKCKKPFICQQCNKSFENNQLLEEHKKRHYGEKTFQCPVCPMNFVFKNDLKGHIQTHQNIKPYSCDICGSNFTRSNSLKRHKLIHTGERPHKCDKCDMTFACIYSMKRHLRKMHTSDKPYKCNYCGRAFALNGERNKHMREHIGEKAYICEECPEAFKYQKELREHQAIHYKQKQKEANGTKSNE